MKKLVVFIFLAFSLVAFQQIEIQEFIIPNNWPEPSYDFEVNPLTKKQIQLGRALFYDPILSQNNTISCASCHSQYNAFTHVDHQLSHGIYDSIGTRNSPTLMNLAWQNSFMWDGAVHNIEVQSLSPISHVSEMGSSINEVVDKLKESKIYPNLFQEAYAEGDITGEYTLKAIAQFMLTLVSANSKYDKVKRGEVEFTEQEQNGYNLFKTNCNACHQEPLFSTFQFENNGLAIDSNLNDEGRFLVSQQIEDLYKFKVPSLRNVEFSYPYMHDGRFQNLREVLNHYENGIVFYPNLAEKLQNNIVLTSNDKVDLTAFLLTLTDKKFLFNKEFSYPREILLPQEKE